MSVIITLALIPLAVLGLLIVLFVGMTLIGAIVGTTCLVMKGLIDGIRTPQGIVFVTLLCGFGILSVFIKPTNETSAGRRAALEPARPPLDCYVPDLSISMTVKCPPSSPLGELRLKQAAGDKSTE